MCATDSLPRYYAYMLRCWAESTASPNQPVIWRFSLEDPHTGVRLGFASFEALVAFLVAELQHELGDAPSAWHD